MTTFGVDDVTPATDRLPARQVGELFPDAILVGGDPRRQVVEPDGVHPLLSAVGRAFAEHRPLVLSPDAVWLTVAHGVAQHVRLHAGELRPRLVAHAGRKRLTVETNGDAGWPDLVETFGKLLAAEVADAELFECDFSTSTEVDRIAGRTVLLDVYSPYFALWMTFVCGIPSVTLTGTPGDWRKIRSRIDRLAVFGLDSWRRCLAPILDQFVRAGAGDADTAFWRRIYSPADAYGGTVVTGWISRLYPYLSRDGSTTDLPNPMLDLPLDEPKDQTGRDGGMGYQGPGVATSSIPATLSRVVVNVNDLVRGENRAVALHAGLVGVAQHADGALEPVAGWHVAPAVIEIEDVLDRIVREHETTPPRPGPDLYAATEELAALYHRIGSASLFGGAWRIAPPNGHGEVWRGYDLTMIHTYIELADGRSVGGAFDDAGQCLHWVVCRTEETGEIAMSIGEHQVPKLRLLDDPADVVVHGTSLAQLLDAALDSGGDIAHLDTGVRLSDLDARTASPAD